MLELADFELSIPGDAILLLYFLYISESKKDNFKFWHKWRHHHSSSSEAGGGGNGVQKELGAMGRGLKN